MNNTRQAQPHAQTDGKKKRKNKNKNKRMVNERRPSTSSQLPQPELAVPYSRFSESGVRGMTIPLSEQDRLMSFLHTNQGNTEVLRYLNTLINPKSCMTRIPDSFARPTALVRSIVTYDITTNLAGGANGGRFAVALRPTLGISNGSPQDWKVSLVSSATNWPTDFTTGASFTSTSGGVDLRVDPFYNTLTSGPAGFLNGIATTPGITAPFGAGTASFTVDTANSFGIGFTIVAAANGRWQLPPGQYFITVATVNTAANIISLTPSIAGNLSTALNGAVNENLPNASVSWIYNVQTYGEYFVITQNQAGSTSVTVSISTTATAVGGGPLDFGMVSQVRPVAMSALASYIGTTLQDGGNIAAAYVPGGSLNSNYFIQASSISPIGSFAFWETLSKEPNAYNGPIRDGAYTWWSPEDYEDLQMSKPSGTPNHNYPSIIIAGQLMSGVTTGIVPVVRLEVVTVYEFVTNSLLFETGTCLGSQAIMDAASSALFGQPHSMPNGIHLKWLADIAKKVASGVGSGARFIDRNFKKIAPILGTVGSLL